MGGDPNAAVKTLDAEIAAHPRGNVIEALAEAMHAIEDDGGNGRHITEYRSLAYATVEILPALTIDEDAATFHARLLAVAGLGPQGRNCILGAVDVRIPAALTAVIGLHRPVQVDVWAPRGVVGQMVVCHGCVPADQQPPRWEDCQTIRAVVSALGVTP